MAAQADGQVELPPELQYSILAAAGRPLLCRQLCQQLSDHASQQLERLTFIECDAPGPVRSLVSWCTALREIDLRRVVCDDELIAWLLQTRQIASIDVSDDGNRSRLTARTLALFRATPSLEWTAGGCWRMHSPHPSLSALDVVTLQVQALRGDKGSGEGIAACFHLISPVHPIRMAPVVSFTAMVRHAYGCMLDATGARVACVAGGGEGDSTGEFLVSFDVPDRSPDDEDVVSGSWLEAMGMDDPDSGFLFHWHLSLQQEGQNHSGCWMTDGLAQLDHGQFAFMNSPTADPLGEVVVGAHALPSWRAQTRVLVI